MSDAVEIAGLTLRFGVTPLLNDVTLSVPRGKVVAVCGRPHTGKSALLACLLGHLKPVAGLLRIGGFPVGQEMAACRQFVTYVDGHGPLVPHLTLRQNLALIARLSGASKLPQATLDGALRQSDIPDRRFTMKASRLSARECLCVWLAAARLRQTPAVLLDDPVASLSPTEAAQTAVVIRELCDFAGVLVTTSDREFADDVADAVYVIEHGHLNASPRLGATFVSGLDELLRQPPEA
jgi:ABC-type multidrug transport system ATPase subunit